jgi:hypothetical protein
MPKGQSVAPTSPRDKLIKIGAQVASYGRYVSPAGCGDGIAADVQGILTLIAPLRAPPAPA